MSVEQLDQNHPRLRHSKYSCMKEFSYCPPASGYILDTLFAEIRLYQG